MTEIKGTPPVQSPLTPKNEGVGSHPNGLTSGNSNKQPQEHPSNKGGGQYRSNSSVFVSQSALETRLNQPYDERSSDDETSKGGDGEHQDVDHLLITITPDKNVVKTPVATQVAAGADQSVKVDEVAKLVSTRIEAAIRPGPTVPPNPLTLSIPLDRSTGLAAVQVTMDNGVLAVTLVRLADHAGHDIQQAALNLAQVLQAQFSTRTVKVSERIEGLDDADEAEAEREETSFASLFKSGNNGR